MSKDIDISKLLLDVISTYGSNHGVTNLSTVISQLGLPGLLSKVYSTRQGRANTFYNVSSANADEAFQNAIEIPVIYGEVLTKGQRADGGKVRSETDPARDLQQYNLICSEGECDGIVGSTDTVKLKNTFLDKVPVLDPEFGTATQGDVCIKQNFGDGTVNKFSDISTSHCVGETDPVTGEAIPIESVVCIGDLNDLCDVETTPCDNHLMYFDGATKEWKSKHINTMLQEVGMTVVAGTGGTGGTGGGGGVGGGGGTGGTSSTTVGPNPTIGTVDYADMATDDYLSTTAITPYGTVGGITSTEGGALVELKHNDGSANRAYQQEVKVVGTDLLRLHFYFDGLYLDKEWSTSTVTTTYTPTPATGYADCFTCIEPPTPATTTTVTSRIEASITIDYCVWTYACGCSDPFILDEGTFTQAGTTFTSFTKSIEIDWQACDATAFINRYPGEIIRTEQPVYITLKRIDAPSASTEVYFEGYSFDTGSGWHGASLTKIRSLQPVAPVNTLNPLDLIEDDGLFPYFVPSGGTYVAGCDDQDGTAQGLAGTQVGATSGGTGVSGGGGSTGTAGASGTPGVLTVPAAPGCPSISFTSPCDKLYTVGSTTTLTKITAITTLAITDVTVTIKITQGLGTLSASPVGTATVTAFNTTTKELVISGIIADVNSTIDAGNVTFTPDVNDTGDIKLYAKVVDNDGTTIRTKECKLRESATETNGQSPEATITLTGTSGSIKILANAVNISGTVSFNTELPTTATALRTAIGATTTVPNYTASGTGSDIIITGPVALGETGNNRVVTATTLSGDLSISGTGIFDKGVTPTTIMIDTFDSLTSGTEQSTINYNLENGVMSLIGSTGDSELGTILDSFIFPWVSQVQVKIPNKAEHQEVSFLYRGKKVKCPNAYTASLHSHSGSWDYSTFGSVVWTNNPAWIFLDYLDSKRFGCGNIVNFTTAQKQLLLQDLWEISKRCDESVSDGLGGTTSYRYTCNTIINGDSDKLQTLENLASVFHGHVYWHDGAMRVFQDRAEDTALLVNQSSVINGQFEYSGASLRTINNVANVSFNNPVKLYKEDTIFVEDKESIRHHGERKYECTAFACTEMAQAVRHGKWLIETEKSDVETITYTAGWDHYLTRPGHIIQVEDSNRYTARRYGGRVSLYSSGTVTIDSSPSLSTTTGITFSVMLNDGTIHTSGISSYDNAAKTVTLSSGSGDIEAGAVWIINDNTIGTRLYRVTRVAQNDLGQFEVSAVIYDSNKYNNIDGTLYLGP